MSEELVVEDRPLCAKHHSGEKGIRVRQGKSMTGIDINKRVKSANGKMCIPIETLISLRNTGELSMKSIAQIMGCSAQNVTNRLWEADAKLRAMKHFRKAKSDLLQVKQMEIMSAMNEKKMKQAPLREQAFALNVVNTMSRLEDNQSTNNTAITYAQIRRNEDDQQDVIQKSEAELKQLEEENKEYLEGDPE
jgi:hypothetical protein